MSVLGRSWWHVGVSGASETERRRKMVKVLVKTIVRACQIMVGNHCDDSK